MNLIQEPVKTNNTFEINKIIKDESEYDKVNKIVLKWNELVTNKIDEMETRNLEIPEKLRASRYVTISASLDVRARENPYFADVRFKRNIVVLRINEIVEGVAIYHKKEGHQYYELDYLITHPTNLNLGISDGEKHKRISGVGTALIKWLAEKCPKAGLKGISLTAQVSSEGFYEKLGFKPKSRLGLVLNCVDVK